MKFDVNKVTKMIRCIQSKELKTSEWLELVFYCPYDLELFTTYKQELEIF